VNTLPSRPRRKRFRSSSCWPHLLRRVWHPRRRSTHHRAELRWQSVPRRRLRVPPQRQARRRRLFQNYFIPAAKARVPKNLLRQNQYGGVFSGPVTIPKLYKARIEPSSCSITRLTRFASPIRLERRSSLPTHSARRSQRPAQPAQRHRAALPAIQVIDPFTGAPFGNNQIPARAFPDRQKLLQFFPAAQVALPTPSAASTISASAAPPSTTISAMSASTPDFGEGQAVRALCLR